jgi:transcriptional regulator with XRE-family HTH domain
MTRLQQAQKLGKMLRDLIHKEGWSVLEAARRAGIHPSSMRDYVGGITFPTKENRELLAPLLGISIQELNTALGLAEAIPKRPVDDLCRDIRLLSPEEFTIVAEVVFNRIISERRNSSPSPPSH